MSSNNNSSSSALFEELEPRLLLSADSLGGLDALVSSDESELGDDTTRVLPAYQEFSPLRADAATPASSEVADRRQELVFVDGGIEDYETLVAGFLAADSDQRGIQVVVLDPDRDGIEQITSALAGRTGLDAVHVVSHGDDASLRLGNTTLDGTSVERYQDAIAGWADALDAEADLLFYGCNLAASEDGRALVDRFSALTGTDVAASEDLTGHASLGGDWDLEYTAGTVETAVAASASMQRDYQHVMATFTVSTTADSGAGSLRQAIIDANTNANPGSTDTIVFDIGADGSQQTINLLTALDPISEAVFIDGFSQYGALTPDVPLIEINGASTTGEDGLVLAAGSDGSTISGLVVNRFDNVGIKLLNSDNHTIVGNYIGTDLSGTLNRGNGDKGLQIENSASNQIGGPAVTQRNVISGNGNDGIILWGAGSTLNTIQGNYVGVDVTGDAPLANLGDGISIAGGANNNTIGGDRTAGEGNVLSGNNVGSSDGIEIDNVGADNNKIYGNYIGTNHDGTATVANARHGVVIYDGVQGTLIGGTGTGQGNIISGNGDSGVIIDGNGKTSTTNNVIAGNLIGVDVTGILDFGNVADGIYIFGSAAGNLIGGFNPGEGNVIAFNDARGIRIVGTGTGNEIVGNTITQNVQFGIQSLAPSTEIVGNVVYSNSTGTPDDEIVLGADQIVYHNTIHGSADDGIYVTGDNAIIRNNIITGSAGFGIRTAGGVTGIQESHNLITDAGTGPANLGGRADFALDPSSLNADPLYLDAANGDFRLTDPGSPAIDAGIDLGGSQPDVNGASGGLYDGAAPDMGTFESWAPVVSTATFQQGVNGYTGTQDTFVDQLDEFNPAADHGNENTIDVDLDDGGGNTASGLIRFDDLFGSGPGQIPFGSTIDYASLSVYVTNPSDAGTQITMHQMLIDWNESSNWDSTGSGVQTDNTDAASAVDSMLGDPDLTGTQAFTGLESTLQAWSDGSANYGWVIITDDTNGLDFSSSEEAVVIQRPKLTISYTLNDPLLVSTTGNTVLFTEDAGATTALFAAAMDTVESGDTVTQVILTLANVEAGDTLVFGASSVDLNTNVATGADANGFTYTVSSAGTTPVVTISHAGATDTLTNTMLNSLVFNNTANNDPSTTARTVTLTSVTDSGSGLTNDGTVATVNVAKADDALAVSTTGNTVLFTEDAGATTALFAASMDTVETGDTVTQVILTLANVEAGDTLTFGATSVDLNTNAATGPDANGFTYTVSSAGASPVVTISHAGATDTLTNTMLNSLVFNNTSNDNPSITARTVTLTSVTDSGSVLTNDGTVATVNVATENDAPVNTVPPATSTPEDTALIFSTGNSNLISISDVDAGNSPLQVSLTATNGNITLSQIDGLSFTVGTGTGDALMTFTGRVDSINAALDGLSFTPDGDYYGAANIQIQTTDVGSKVHGTDTVLGSSTTAGDFDKEQIGTQVFIAENGTLTSLSAYLYIDKTQDVRVGLYADSAGEPGALIVESNVVSLSPGTNWHTIDVPATAVTSGTYWLAMDIGKEGAYFYDSTGGQTRHSNYDPAAGFAAPWSGTYASNTQSISVYSNVIPDGAMTEVDTDNVAITVDPVDDPLVVSITGNTVMFTEGAGATTALFAASMDTVEAGDTVTQMVLTLANVEAGDTLTFGATSVDLNTNAATGPDANGFTYTVSSAGASPVVTISHAGASDTLTNTMLNSLVFNNTSNDDPSTTARTVTLTSVTDSGSGLTNDGTVATVNVALDDDALSVSTTGNTVLFTEDAGATTALFAAAMDTVETGDTVTQVILTLANVEAGDTLLFGATSVDLNTNAATAPDANGFTYTVSSAGASPVVTISHAGATDTLTNTMLNSLVFNNTSNDNPSITARTVTLTSVTDSGSGLTNDGTVATVNVAKADDALAVSTTGNTVLFTEGGGSTSALFAAAMDTVESGDAVTQVVLTLANVEAGDTLTFGATSIDLNTNAATGPDGNGFTYTVSSAGTTPVLTISHAGAADTLTNTMLNSLVFNNTSNDDPSTTARTVTLTSVTDSGSGLTNDGTVATVNVALDDDPLVVSTTGNTVLFTEDAGATSALFAASMDTVETGDTVTQIILTLANVEAGDTLVFGATSVDLNTNAATGPDANGFTYTVSSAGTTPEVTISHAGATDTLTNTMLNSLVFNNTANDDPGTTARTVTVTSVTDSGSGLTNDGTVATVNVAKADDPLAVSTTGNTVLFTEDAGATSALFAATMDTVETGDTVTQVILTLANVEAGDTLLFGATSVNLNTNAATGPDGNGFTYTVSSAGASPVVTISHAGATDTQTNTMLNSLVFNNTSNDDPGTTARTVTLTSVTDSGSGLTNDGTVATVNVAKADDALLVSTTGNTVLFTEDAGATTALFAASMDTVETGDTVTQVILTLANVEAGDTLLFGATSVDLNTNAATGPDGNGFTYTVSSAGATPVVTISHAGATDTLTNTMLNSLVFNNTANNDPSTTARTVTLTSVTDSGSGLTNDGTVATVNVAKADDALNVATTGNTVLFTEDAGATTALFAASMDTVETGDTVTQVILTLANVEAGDTLTFGATSVDLNTNAATGPDGNGFTYTVSSAGATPVVTISHAGATDTLTNTMLNSLVFNNTTNNDPSTTARTVTLTSVTDSGSGLTNDGTVATVNVAKTNDALNVATTGNTVLFTEDAGATTALFAASIDTVETGDTVTQVILTLANVEAGDTLLFGATSVDLNTNAATGPDGNGFTFTVSSAGATPVVTISHAGATDALTNTMLNSLVFNNTANNDPSTTARTVTLTSVTDSGSGLTNDGTVATVNVAKADDALLVSTTGNTVLFTEDAGATTALFAASMDTVETGDTVTQVILTLANVEAGDTLLFGATSVDLNTNAATGPDGNGFTFTVSSAGATPVVTISHAGATDALTNTMLNSLVFNNTANNDPSTTARTVTLTSVTDSGSGLTNDGTVATVNVAKADDALLVSTTGNTVLFTEDAGATTALFAASMDTVETGDTVTQVILTLANVEAGDTLVFGATSVDLNTNAATGPDANGFTYTVSSGGAAPVVTISHAGATDTLTNTMLNSLVFNNTANNDPGTTARTVTLTSVTDSGSGLTTDGTVATVNVARADDALVVSTTGNTVLFTEDAGATTALYAASMDTVETGDTVTQVVLTLANVEAGDTLLFGATSVDLNTNAATGPDANGFTYTVSSAGATPVVTISHAGASDTLTNTMLNSLVFNNTANNDPSTIARTVTLTSVTDSGSGLTNDGTVATVNVAKADDALLVSTTGNTVLFTEDAGATSALFAAVVDTVETGDTVTQVILTLANVEAGDTLVFGATSVDLNTNATTGPDANGFTYTVSSAGATPAVTISHAGATDTLTNTMLNSIVFNNTANNDPGTTARTVTLTSVTDSGSGLTNDGTVATVNVVKADDPINVATTGNTVLFTEDAGATSALFAAAMDTVETGDTVTQVVLTLANVEAGDTLLFGATSVDLNTNAATGPDANGFTYTVSSAGATPVVTISHAGASDTLTNTMLNSLVFNNTANNDPGTTARTVTLTSVTDSGSGLTNDGTVATVNVAKADDALNVATTGNTVLFTEDAGATAALFVAAMDTVETGDTVTQVILTLANVEPGDTLLFGASSVDLNTNAATGPDANGFTYTVSSAGTTPVVTINHAGASDTLTNTMLNSLVFNNTANNDPSTTARTVTLTSVTDSGSGLTSDGTVATVNVVKADDPLAVSTTGNTVLFTEDAGATTALFAASMDTVETGDTVTQVILTLANVEAGDTLLFGATSIDLNTNAAIGPDANGFTYTVSSAGASPVVTISHAGATDTQTNTMLNSLVFNNTSNDDPGTTARTVTLTSVTDSGSGLTNDGTVATVNVAKADDALLVSTTGNTVLFTEDAGATTALFAASMDTVETGDTVTQVILTLANVEAGDTLLFGATSVDLNTNAATGPDGNGFTYTVSSAGATPVVTISHAGATDTQTNTMLNSLVFNNTSNDDPGTTARTVTLTSVTDSGSGLTNDGTVATVNVAKADDALLVSTTGNTVLFTEDAGATTALFAASMDTVETGDTVTQVILTLANVEAGDTLTFGATSIDLNTNAATGPDGNGFTYTVSSAGTTPVVTISHAGATDTLTNTMLNSLVFNNTANNDPGTTARTVTLTSVTDSGSGLSNDGTVATVNVAKADDALAVSTTGNTVLFTEDAGATSALFAASMDTVETGDTVTQVILTLANVEAGDTLLFGATSVDLNTNAATGPDGNGFTYTVSSAGATPVVTISHAGATDTLTNTMLNSLVFNNTANNDPSTTARTVTLTSVTDSGSGLTNDGTVATVNVAKTNDAPTVNLINVVTSLAETTSTATAIKIADIVVTDVDAGTNNLTLAGDDLAHFEIVGTELRLKAGTSLDFEIPADADTNHVFDVTVVVDDPGAGGTPDDTAATTLTVTDVNENPGGAGTLTTTSLNDNAGPTNLFGGLTVSDPDSGENDLSVTITLTNPAAGVIGGGFFTDLGGGVYRATGLTVAQADTALDNATFTPTDGTGPSGTFTTDITLTVNDQGGGGEQSVLSATTVTITRVNTAPSGLPVIEGAPVETQILTATTDDISDADGLGTFSFQWLRDGVPIATATESSYTLVGADRGTRIAVRVEFIDGNGATERVTSVAVGPVSEPPAPEPEPESEDLPPAADTLEKVDTPPPIDEVELSAVLPATEDLVVAGDAQPTQATPTGESLIFEPQFLSQITQLLDAAAAGSVTSAGVSDRPAPLVDAQFLLRDRAFEPIASEMRPISDSSYESSARQALIAGVQDMQNTMTASGDSRIEAEEFRQTVIQGTLGTLSVGSVTWLLRAGSLLASVFSSIPMWSTMDPLPVLDVSAKERKRRLKASSNAGDDASEQRMDEILERADSRSSSRDNAS